MARVRLERVTKRFGNVKAVDGVSLDVEDGEFFVLLGPSGCGKTTTLRLVAGLEYPDEGHIYIDGRDVTFLDPKDRDVAMVFQNYALYPHMTVFQNIAFPLELRRRELGLSRAEIKRRVEEVARLLRIEELLSRKPGQLSGGQQQRVALARALVRRPKVWLMDEPLSNLDALLRLHMRAELKKLQKELGITTIYVTHDQAEALSMADRIAVMNRGRVVQVGTPDEVYLKPAHSFVATFVGTPPMNLVECEIVDSEKGGLLECPGLERRIPPEIHSSLRDMGIKRVLLGLRPEFLEIAKEKTLGAFQGRVYVVEPLGSEAIVNVVLDNDKIIKVKSKTRDYSPGQQVWVKPDWIKTSLFDPQTGKAIQAVSLLEEY